MPRQVFYDVVHLDVQSVTSEHVPVLLADLFDAFQRKSAGCELSRLQVVRQTGDERGPVCVHISFAHEAYHFQKLVGDQLGGAAHEQVNQIFLENLEGVMVYIKHGIVFISGHSFALFPLLLFVVSEGVLPKSFSE